MCEGGEGVGGGCGRVWERGCERKRGNGERGVGVVCPTDNGPTVISYFLYMILKI